MGGFPVEDWNWGGEKWRRDAVLVKIAKCTYFFSSENLYKSQIVFVKPRWEDSQWKIGTGWREVENRVEDEQLFKSQVARSYIFPSYTITLTNKGITMSTKTE